MATQLIKFTPKFSTRSNHYMRLVEGIQANPRTLHHIDGAFLRNGYEYEVEKGTVLLERRNENGTWILIVRIVGVNQNGINYPDRFGAVNHTLANLPTLFNLIRDALAYQFPEEEGTTEEETPATDYQTNFQVSQIQYDIPAEGNNHDHFARRLREFGVVRTSRSCWVIRTEHVPHHVLAEPEAVAAEAYRGACDCSKLDVSETRKKIEQAIRYARLELEDRERMARQVAERALREQRNDRQLTTEEIDARLQRQITRTEQLITELQANLQMFTGTQVNLSDSIRATRTAFAAISGDTMRQARLYAQMAATAARIERETGSRDAGAIAAAARQDAIPAGILADWLADQGLPVPEGIDPTIR